MEDSVSTGARYADTMDLTVWFDADSAAISHLSQSADALE